MARDPTYLEELAGLHLIVDGQQRAVAWRQGLASLAALSPEREPAPLEGIPAELLLASVQAAAAAGLLEDVGFLAPSLAGRALFELASALPASPEKRELGRAVLRRLREGDRATFVALATALAVSGGRFLDGPTRTRAVLTLAGARQDSPAVDALALAILSRRDLERDWLVDPSTGSLPSRRLAARLLERSARAAWRRLAGGDDGGIAAFDRAAVRGAWRRLLDDREALVWRHAAVARGLLAGAFRDLADEIEAGLSTALSPTEWRRAAASSAAWLAIDRAATERLRGILRGALVQRDPGVARSVVVGLGSAHAIERELVDELAAEAVEIGGLEAVHGVIELRREVGGAAMRGGFAIGSAQAWIETALGQGRVEGDQRVVLDAMLAELASDGEPHAIDAALAEALGLARDGDLAGGRAAALRAIARAAEVIDGLAGASDAVAAHRRHVMRAVGQLDRALFEQDVARNLATAGDGPDAAAELADIYDRLSRWLVDREAAASVAQGGGALEVRQVRLRALLHLVDSEPERADGAARERRLGVVRSLLRLSQRERSGLRRAVWATLARACDALLRDEVVEFSDVLLGLAGELGDTGDIAILEEASMLPDLSRVLAAHAAALAAARHAEIAHDPASAGASAARASAIASLREMARALPPATARRVDALRLALSRIAAALAALDRAASLAAVPADALDRLEQAAVTTSHLMAGARRRLGLPVEASSPVALSDALRAVARALGAMPSGGRDRLTAAVAAAAACVGAVLPAPVTLAIRAVLSSVAQLPVELDEEELDEGDLLLEEPETHALPDWLPPSRILGGFYVMGALGSGSGGSVFVACRAEDRHAPEPELHALKVPDYGGAAARSLSQEEFSRLFREEASALLALPAHPNLASFVTFDVRARPKPILVMELVRGPSLAATLDLRRLDIARALAMLDDVAAGLGAMHALRVGHLDVKPSNVILRDDEAPGGAVLVDFGLAGRRLRPGCGSAHYGAPEVWTTPSTPVDATSEPPAPEPADVYAFGCLVYEVLTGQALVTGDTAMLIVASHVAGIAGRGRLLALARTPALAPLASLIEATLARDPTSRPVIADLRASLAALAPQLTAQRWPLAARA